MKRNAKSLIGFSLKSRQLKEVKGAGQVTDDCEQVYYHNNGKTYVYHCRKGSCILVRVIRGYMH